MSFNHSFIFITLSLITSLSFSAKADTLSDLKAKLKSLNGNSPLNAVFSSSYTEKEGEDEDLTVTSGNISYSVSYNDNGLHISYSKDILNKITNERELLEKNEKAETPSLNAMKRVKNTDILDNLSIGPTLLELINKGELIGEEVQNAGAEESIKLRFNLPMDKMITDEKSKDFIDEFEGQLAVIVDNKGNPISSKFSFSGNGTAYMFFDMNMSQTSTSNYKVVDNRLVQVSESFANKQSSTFGDNQSSGENSITLLAN